MLNLLLALSIGAPADDFAETFRRAAREASAAKSAPTRPAPLIPPALDPPAALAPNPRPVVVRPAPKVAIERDPPPAVVAVERSAPKLPAYSPPVTYPAGFAPVPVIRLTPIAPAPRLKLPRRVVPIVPVAPIIYTPDLPPHAVEYRPARFTQRIATTNDRPSIDPSPIARLPDMRWHQSGGMLGVRGWKSEKFKVLPKGWNPGEAAVRVPVLNSFGSYQREVGLVRVYPVGTSFRDVLRNEATGKVFEDRERVKVSATEWSSQVLYRDESQYPKGYTGLKVACASCHNAKDGPGTGGYALGLVPGSDTVFSDPLPWGVWNPAWARFDRE